MYTQVFDTIDYKESSVSGIVQHPMGDYNLNWMEFKTDAWQYKDGFVFLLPDIDSNEFYRGVVATISTTIMLLLHSQLQSIVM